MDSISEKTIEDILSSDKSILAEILSLNANDLSLVARQKLIESGKLDLLYLHRDELLLIELKIVNFYRDIIGQINDYYDDLLSLQAQNKLINSKIKKIVLVAGSNSRDIKLCERHSISVIVYRPEYVLAKFFENFKELSYFLKIQSGDFGVVRLGLLKNTLYLLSQGKKLNELCNEENRSEKTIKNRLSVATLLNLTIKHKHQFYLTDFGNSFVESTDSGLDDRLSIEQVEMIAEFVSNNPFYSSITYTIISLIESVFVLSKSNYPVPMDLLKEYFIKSVGKEKTWRTDRARHTATYIFSNYSCELGFLSKYSDSFYITPKGIQSVLILQLNRSIKLIESQQI